MVIGEVADLALTSTPSIAASPAAPTVPVRAASGPCAWREEEKPAASAQPNATQAQFRIVSSLRLFRHGRVYPGHPRRPANDRPMFDRLDPRVEARGQAQDARNKSGHDVLLMLTYARANSRSRAQCSGTG